MAEGLVGEPTWLGAPENYKAMIIELWADTTILAHDSQYAAEIGIDVDDIKARRDKLLKYVMLSEQQRIKDEWFQRQYG